MKHKKKGTYVNHVNGKYYLYAAHSERIPGTKKVRRVSDGYIGRITEKEGLIPARHRISGDIRVYEFGLSTCILKLCKKIHAGFRRTFKHNADYVMAASILSVMYDRYDQDCMEASYLSVRFPGLSLQKIPTEKQAVGIERGRKMITDTLATYFGEDFDEALFHFKQVYKIQVNTVFYLSKESAATIALKNKYEIGWEDDVYG